MLEMIGTPLKNAKIIKGDIHKDNRGSLIKPYSDDLFLNEDILFEPLEVYYSISKKNVLRGMHFQKEPYGCDKIINVIDGKILDVVLDINPDSRTFGKSYAKVLSSDKNESIYIRSDMAHGFLTLSESATVLYIMDQTFYKEADSGLMWNSFGFDWGIENPIISEKDTNLKEFKNYLK